MANKEGEVNTTVLGASPFAHKGFFSNLGVLLVGWLFWVTNCIKNFVLQGLMSSKPDSDNITNWRGLPFQFFWIAHKKPFFCVDLWSWKKKKRRFELVLRYVTQFSEYWGYNNCPQRGDRPHWTSGAWNPTESWV